MMNFSIPLNLLTILYSSYILYYIYFLLLKKKYKNIKKKKVLKRSGVGGVGQQF